MTPETKNKVDKVTNTIKSTKQKEVVKILIKCYENVNGNDKMLETSFVVFLRLNEHICHLPIKLQTDIIHEATMIAYDARIATFDEILKPKAVTNSENLRIT